MAKRATQQEMDDAMRVDGLHQAVPEPENGGRAKSHAAHLGGAAHESTKPAGGLKHGVTLGELREPPQITSRIGKEHRKQ